LQACPRRRRRSKGGLPISTLGGKKGRKKFNREGGAATNSERERGSDEPNVRGKARKKLRQEIAAESFPGAAPEGKIKTFVKTRKKKRLQGRGVAVLKRIFTTRKSVNE